MKKFFIGGAIVLAIMVMILLNLLNNKDAEGTKSVIGRGKTQEVEVSRIEKGSISSSILITGSVKEINSEEITSTSPVKIKEVLVRKGDKVAKGDQLFIVDVTSLEEELSQLDINLEVQKLTIQKIEALKVTSDLTSLEVAKEVSKLSLEAAQRLYDNQVANLEKNQLLYDGGIISKAELEGIQSAVTEAESQLTSATLQYNRSKNDLANMASTNASSVDSSAIDLKIQQMNLDSLQMNRDRLEQQIADILAISYASIDGVITLVAIEDGDTTNGMSPFIVITDVEHLRVVASVREYDVRNLDIGQQVYITGDAIAKEEAVEAEVSYIAPIAADTMINGRQSTAIEIEMTVVKGAECLKPGYTTDCEIITSRIDNAIIASYEMLSEDEEGNDIVFVVRDGIAIETILKLGVTSDFDAQVLEGLEEGDLVVLNPSLSLFDKSKVEIMNDLEEEGN